MLTAPPGNAEQAIASLLADPAVAPLIVAHRELEPRPPQHAPWPTGIDPRLIDALRRRGIDAELVIGAGGLENGARPAHAWVEVNGEPVNDQPDVRVRYGSFGLQLPRLTKAGV